MTWETNLLCPYCSTKIKDIVASIDIQKWQKTDIFIKKEIL